MSTSEGKTCIYSPMRSEDDARGRDTKMNAFYVRTGETGKPVSRIFLGTAGAPYASGREADALLDEMFAAGITAYDTARKYGRAEECLGKWICSRRNREKIFLLTKCGHPGPLGNARVNRRAMRADLERSLCALKTDYVDALLLHRDDERVPVGEVVEIFNEMFREGKIRAFGGSNWRHERIAAANAYAEQRGMRPFSFSSPNFGLAVQAADPWGGGCVSLSGEKNASARAWYVHTQMPVVAYSSLGRGLFSGKVTDAESARRHMDRFARRGYACEENFERARRCAEIAAQKGVSCTQVALSWIFRQQMNVFAVVGTSSPQRMRENVAAYSLALTEEECACLDLKN